MKPPREDRRIKDVVNHTTTCRFCFLSCSSPPPDQTWPSFLLQARTCNPSLKCPCLWVQGRCAPCTQWAINTQSPPKMWGWGSHLRFPPPSSQVSGRVKGGQRGEWKERGERQTEADKKRLLWSTVPDNAKFWTWSRLMKTNFPSSLWVNSLLDSHTRWGRLIFCFQNSSWPTSNILFCLFADLQPNTPKVLHNLADSLMGVHFPTWL